MTAAYLTTLFNIVQVRGDEGQGDEFVVAGQARTLPPAAGGIGAALVLSG
jgi:hypothetical protein